MTHSGRRSSQSDQPRHDIVRNSSRKFMQSVGPNILSSRIRLDVLGFYHERLAEAERARLPCRGVE